MWMIDSKLMYGLKYNNIILSIKRIMRVHDIKNVPWSECELLFFHVYPFS